MIFLSLLIYFGFNQIKVKLLQLVHPIQQILCIFNVYRAFNHIVNALEREAKQYGRKNLLAT